MKFLTLSLLIICCLAYRVKKEPFTPSAGVLTPANNQKLTTNYQEMVNNADKHLISLDLPEHIDLDQNIALGDKYEDVVYVKDAKKQSAKKASKASSQRLSLKKKQGEFSEEEEDIPDSEEEQELNDLLDIEFNADVETAAEALQQVERHQEQITDFLQELSKNKEPNQHERTVVTQLYKYVKQVQQAYDAVRKSDDDDDSLNALAEVIHEYTLLLDEHKYNESRWDSTQKPLVGKSQDDNDEVVELVADSVERVVGLLDKEDFATLDVLLESEKAEHFAQVAAKVIQTRILIDKIKHAHVEKNNEPQYALLNDYKTYIKAEQKLVRRRADELEELNQMFLDHEDEEITQDLLQRFVDDENLSTKVREAAQAAIEQLDTVEDSSDPEDPGNYQAQVKIQLIKHEIVEEIDAYAKTDALVSTQYIKLMSVSEAIAAGDMHSVEEILNEIVDETSEKQVDVLANTFVTQQSQLLRRTVRAGQFRQAQTQARKLVTFLRTQTYAKPSQAKLDQALNESEEVARDHRAEVNQLAELTKSAADLVLAQDRQQAEDLIEQVAGLTQQLAKAEKFRRALLSVQQGGSVEDAVEGLDTLLETELNNLNTDRDQLSTSLDNVHDLQESTNVEDWEESHEKALNIVDQDNLNARARWAVKTAAQYIELNVYYEVKVQLAHASAFTTNDLSALDASIASVERQQELLSSLADASDAEEVLEQLLEEVETRQSVVEISEEIQANAEQASQLLANGAYEDAVDAVHRISDDVVDPHGLDKDDTFEAALEQGEGNGLEPDQGLDISEAVKSPAELEKQENVDQVQALYDQVAEAVEDEDRLAAEEALETLYAFVQKQYKLLDLQTTLNIVKNYEEVGADGESYATAVGLFRDSNEHEEELLKNYANDLLGLKEDVQAILDGFEESENTDLSASFTEIGTSETATSAIRALVNEGVDLLEENKRANAQDSLEKVLQRVEELQNDVESSLSSIENQQEVLDAAIAAAEESDFDEVREQLDQIQQLITESQSVVLTDQKASELFENARSKLLEGALNDANEFAQQIAEALQNEYEAQFEAVSADPTASPSDEVQEAAAEELEKDIENAEEAIENGTQLEALEQVEAVEQEIQSDAKVKLVEEVKQEVADALEEDDKDRATEAVESLVELIEEEEAAVEEDKEELEEIVEQIEEIVEDDEDEPAEEVEEEAEELLEEVEDVDAVPAAVEAVLEEAEEAAEEGNVGEADEKLEEALDDLQEETAELDRTEEVIGTQIEQLGNALEAIQDGDDDRALLELSNVALSVDDQPNVQISEEAAEQAEEAKEAIEEGNVDEAVDLVEEIVDAADEEIQEQLEEAEIEVDDEESEEDAGDAEEQEELVSLIEAVVKAITPEDPAELDQDAALEAVQALKENDAASTLEVQVSEIEIAVEGEDYQTAERLLNELLQFVDPDSEEEDDGVTKNLLPELEQRFHGKTTKAMKKARANKAKIEQRMKNKVASLSKKFQKVSKNKKAAKKH